MVGNRKNKRPFRASRKVPKKQRGVNQGIDGEEIGCSEPSGFSW